MKIRTIILSAAVAAGSLIGTHAGAYNVTVTCGEDADGAMAYLVNYDTGDKIDSVTVADSKAVFKGNLNDVAVARLIIDGQRVVQFILEDGDIAVDAATRKVQGGKYNNLMNELYAQVEPIAQRFQTAANDSVRQAIYNEYTSFMQKSMTENLDNPIGYMFFLQQAYDMEPSEVEAMVEQHPSLKKYKRVEKLIQANKNKAATQPGSKFADFEIEYDGVKHRLSNVVGKGQYVLVDFWASWCGPCIRQTAVIKDLYNEYKDKGLKVLGVAVWDEPDDTKKAITQHGLEWECWLNGQNTPTDIYGISGIPCIILFGPDGTILSRDKQDEDLKADVRAALEKAN